MGGCRRRQRPFAASQHRKLFEDFVYFTDFFGARFHLFHELDISIAGQLRIREQLGHRGADGPAHCVSDRTSKLDGEANDTDQYDRASRGRL